MKRLLTVVLIALLAVPLEARSKEADRVQNAGTVMKEILTVPDDIPQPLLDKAECVIVLPSVMKFAFVFGGSYGRGVMTCRSGSDFAGPWGRSHYDGVGRRQLRVSRSMPCDPSKSDS